MTPDRFFTTRREFIGGSLTLLSAAATLPVFLGHTARAFADVTTRPARGKDASSRILVVVQLAGGNDGLNTVVPYEMDGYYKHRRTLAIPAKDALKIGQGVGLHPAATGLKELFDDGKMAIVQGVGYPNPNRSHFTSMDIWHTADPLQKQRDGWIGRYFDHCCKGEDPTPEPTECVALMQEMPLAVQGSEFTGMAFEGIDALTWRAGERDERAAAAFRKLNNQGLSPSTDAHGLAAYLQRAALKAQIGAEDIKQAGAGAIGTNRRGRFGQRGGRLAQELKMVAQMIKADLPTRIYYVSLGGFDTHAGQLGRHAQLMDQFGDAMKSFIDQLQEDGLLDRVLVMSFSEFGRRVQENASGGTDHGEAAPMFLFGSKIRPGLHEKHPDLSKLNRGDLAFGCDFRRVYASVLRDWLKARPEKVLGQSFAPLPLVKSA